MYPTEIKPMRLVLRARLAHDGAQRLVLAECKKEGQSHEAPAAASSIAAL